MNNPINERCRELASPGYVNFTLSILILVGILISYLPQHFRIVRLRSSFGISPYFVLLGVTSGTSGFANILVLPKSGQDVACCREISDVACFAGLLGIFQVGVQCTCFYVILCLFVVYFPRITSSTHPTLPEGASPKPNGLPSITDPIPSYKTAITVTAICVLHALAVAIASLVIMLSFPSHQQVWANVLGIMAALLASIQYFPQIYTTFRLRRVGSLSIPMMCIQTPGSLVWAASLAVRLGKEGWSAWGVYIVTACLQGTLLAMGIYFEYLVPKKDGLPVEVVDDVDRANARGERHATSTEEWEAEDGGAAPTEETPLLGRE